MANQIDFTLAQINQIKAMLVSAGLWDAANGKIVDVTDPNNPITTQGAFAAIYAYIGTLIPNGSANQIIWYWFSKAPAINSDDRTVPADNFIRGATQYGLEYNHKLDGLSQSQINSALQLTSNLIGQNVVQQIIRDNGIRDFDTLLSGDIGAAIARTDLALFGHNLQQTVGGWGGSFYFWDRFLHYRTSTQTTVGNAIYGGIRPESPNPSIQEFYWNNANATADFGISQFRSLVPSGSLPGVILKFGLAGASDIAKNAKDAWDAISAGWDAKAPDSVKARLTFILTPGVELGRLLAGKFLPGPHSSLNTTAPPFQTTATRDTVTASYADGSSYSLSISSSGQNVTTFRTSSGDTGTASIASSGAITVTALDADGTRELAVVSPDSSVAYVSGAAGAISTFGARQTLAGGAGNNVYLLQNISGKTELLTDTDGQGSLWIGASTSALTGSSTRWFMDPSNKNRLTWQSADGQIKYTLLDGNVNAGGTLEITGPGIGGGNVLVNGYKKGNLGLDLNTQKVVAVSVDASNVNPINSSGFVPVNASADIGERLGKIVKFFLNGPASSGDVVEVAAANGQGLYLTNGASTQSLASGNVQLTLTAGQTEVEFLVWDKDAITQDQTATISATWVGADGTRSNAGQLALTVHNMDDPADPPQDPQTTRTIMGDLHPIDYNPPNKVYHYDALGNVITDGTPEPDRADTLYGSAGSDLIDGAGGNDRIDANQGGNDLLKGGAGDDEVNAGAGDDRVQGGAGRDVLRGDAFGLGSGKDLVEGGADADIVYGNGGDDRLYGGDYLKLEDAITQGDAAAAATGQGDFVQGVDGNDSAVGSNRADLLGGGDGNDLLVGGGGDDILEGDATFSANTRDWTMAVTNVNNTYTFTVNGASRFEGTGDDRIYAGAGNDGVLAGAGSDLVDAGTGNDTVFGEAGDDQILGGDGDDVLVGDNATGSLPISQHGNDFIDGGAGNDLILGYGGNDALFGGDGNDTIAGDANDITTGGGDDYLNGEGGNDSIFGYTGSDTLLGGVGDDTLVGDNGGTDTTGGTDFIDGGAGNDQLYGQGGDDTLQGDEGTDFLQGDAGADQLDGGAGNDTLQGGEGDDRLAGGADNDRLQGGAGDDWLDGGVGADMMLGGAGNDMLQGGDGADWVQADAGDDFLDGGTGAGTVLGGDGADMLAGGDDNDQVQGDAGDDQLDGGAGADTLFGGFGQDLVAGGDGNDLLVGDNGGSDSASDGNDVLDGGAGNDQMYGQGGADLLQGGEGDDGMNGGGGNDTLIGGGGNDAYFYNLGGGIDHISDSGGFDFVVFGSGIFWDSLDLGLGSLKIGFGASAGELHIDDFDPNDPYNSGSIEFFQFADGSVHSYAELLAKGFTIGGTPDADELFGTAVNDTIHALASNDLVDGAAGNDLLYGDGGNDLLFGGDGDDHLWGGDGDDVLAGNAGTDLLEGGVGNDVYVFGLGDGQDTVIDAVGSDTIGFGAGITGANLRASRAGNDLAFSVIGTTDRLTIKDWFVNAQGVAQVVLGDGNVLDHAGILDLMKNAPPMLNADAASVKEDTTLTASGNALTNDFDPEGRALRVTNAGTSAGTYGSLSLTSSGAFTYTLNNGSAAVQALAPGQTVADAFTYTATDDDPNGAMSSSSTITVSVVGTNDAPVTVLDRAGVVEDQTTPATGNVLANDSDVDNGTVLRVAAPGTFNSVYGTLTLAVNGDASYTLNNAALAVQSLGAGATAVDHFSYAATDGTVSTPGRIDVTVTGRNDAPVLATPIADVGASPNASFSLTLASNTFTDVDVGDLLTWSAKMADGTALPSWLAFDAGTHTFSGRTPRTATGYLDVLVAAGDRSGASASDVFRITFGGSQGGGGGGGGGGGNGGGGSGGNEGVGNGQDAPPPGQSYNFNDGPGTSPGNPGAKGGNGNTPHAPAPLGTVPTAAATELQALASRSVAAPPGLAAGHGDGQTTNNGQHNGSDNGVGLNKPGASAGGQTPLSASLADGLPPPATQAAMAAPGTHGAAAAAGTANAAEPQHDFGAVARHLAQTQSTDYSALSAREIAQQWKLVMSALPAFAQEDLAAHDSAAQDGSAGHDGAAVSGWGYAGSTGRTANGSGLATFTGLTEGFGRLG